MTDPAAPAVAPEAERMLILDFGSQVTQLIARRVRESGVYCEIWPYNADPDRIRAFAPRGHHPLRRPRQRDTMPGRPRAPQEVFDAGVPVLGICYGQQVMCEQLGGEVEGSEHREFGRAYVDVTDCALFHGVWQKGGREQVWMSHGDRVTRLPPGFRAVAVSEGAPFAAIADDSRRFYGVHVPPRGGAHAARRASCCATSPTVCGLLGHWTMAGFRDAADRPHPRAGRRRAGDLRPVRRRRQRGRRGADP